MKKITTTLLSMMIILSLCSCSSNPKTNGYVKSAKSYGYYSVFNVSYGMPMDECKKALNVSEKDIKIISKAELGEGYENSDVQAFSFGRKLFNKDVTAVFFIYGDVTKTGHNSGLSQINVIFKKPITIVDIQKDIDKDLELKKLSYKKGGTGALGAGYSNSNQILNISDKVVREKSSKLANVMYGKLYNTKMSSADEIELDGIRLFSKDGINILRVDFCGEMASVVGIATNQDIK